MAEITTAYFAEEFNLSRKRATALTIGISMILGTLCALSFGRLADISIFGMTIFNLFDYVSSNILLPLGGLIISVFVGWILDRTIVTDELMCNNSSRIITRSVVFCLRWLAPVCIGLVFIFGLGIF